VYTAGGDSTVRGYEARTGSLEYEFVGHQYCINTIKVDLLRVASEAPTFLSFCPCVCVCQSVFLYAQELQKTY